MILTFIIDTPVMALFGLLFSLAHKRAGHIRAFFHGTIFSTIFITSIFIAFYMYPDWMWMYFIELRQLSIPEMLYISFALYYIPYVFGFSIGSYLMQRSIVLWIFLAISFLGIEAWLIMHLWDRYSVIGTMHEFQNGNAISLFSPNKLSPILNGSIGILILYYCIFCYFTFRKKNKKLFIP